MKHILVTGANGFVGVKLCNELFMRGYKVTAAVQEKTKAISEHIEQLVIEYIDSNTNWSSALVGVDVIVHLAARVHIMHETESDPLLAFRKVNVEGTKCLAKEALSAGVKRFIFMSTLHVNGINSGSKSFCEDDIPNPQNPYAVSKLEAETWLRENSKLETVIIRPPLVYGPNVKANFLSLLKLANSKLPLPFKNINNKRSLISIVNLVDFVCACVTTPEAANELFLVSDDDDISIGALISKLRIFLNRPPRLFSLPDKLLYNAAAIFGKKQIIDRLCGSLQADISKAKNLLNWHPPQSLDDGLREVVKWL